MQKQTSRIAVVTCMFVALGYMLWSWHSEIVAEVFALKTRLKDLKSHTEKSHENMRSTIFENVSPPTKYFDGIGDDVLQQLGQMFVYKTISKALLLDHIPHVAWEREVASEHAFLTGIALDMLSLPLSKTEIYESKLSSINKEHGATKLSKLGAVLFKEAIPEKMCEELSRDSG